MKKDKLIKLISCIAVMSVAMCSCNAEAEETEEEATTVEETTEATTEETTEETTTEETTEATTEETEPVVEEGLPAAYEEILFDFCFDVFDGEDRFAQGLADHGHHGEFNLTEENGIYLYNIGSYGGNNPADGYFFGYYGYKLMDINSDGIPEMLIMDTQLDEQKYCMYTIDENGNAVRLFILDSGEHAFILEDGYMIIYSEFEDRFNRYVLEDSAICYVDSMEMQDDGSYVYEYAQDHQDAASVEFLGQISDPSCLSADDYATWRELTWHGFAGDSEFVSFEQFLADNTYTGDETSSDDPAEGEPFCPEGNTVVLPGTQTTLTLQGDFQFIEGTGEPMISYNHVLGAYASDDLKMDIYYSEYGSNEENYLEVAVSYQRSFSDCDRTDCEIVTADGTFGCRILDVGSDDAGHFFAFLSVGDDDSRYVVVMEASDITEIQSMLQMFS